MIEAKTEAAFAVALDQAIAEGTATKEDIFRLEARLAELELRLTWRILGGVGALLAVAVARLLFAS